MYHCIKVEKSSGTKPSSSGDSVNPVCDETAVGKIIDTYRDHPSVLAVKSSVTQNSKFNLPYAANQDITKIINSFSIPVTFIKLSANVIHCHLANIRNEGIDLNCYSEHAKIHNVRPNVKTYSTSHVLIKLIEKWRKSLDQILMDLPNCF